MTLLMIGALTFLGGAAATRWAITLNILDKPNYRKIHTKPVPKAGGIGIFVPILLFMLWMMWRNPQWTESVPQSHQAAVFGVTLFLFAVGIVDDKIELSVKKKFLFQLLAAVITTAADIRFQVFGEKWADMLLTVFWLVGFINAVNLVDGLDGLAGGIGGIACLGVLYFGWLYQNIYLLFISMAAIGGLAGFLVYNRHPARIFMGDAGSLPLGYLLAVFMVLTGNQIGGFGGAAIAVFLAAVPVYDTALSILRRKLHGRGIFEPDRSHFYNLLMDKKGLSHRGTVWFIYMICGLMALTAIVLDYVPPIYRYITAVAVIIAAFAASIKNHLLEVDPPEQEEPGWAQDRDGQEEHGKRALEGAKSPETEVKKAEAKGPAAGKTAAKKAEAKGPAAGKAAAKGLDLAGKGSFSERGRGY